MADGEEIWVSGTLSGTKQVEKLTEVSGVDIEVTLSEHLAFFAYDDRPGIVGTVGNILGGAGVNIANMQVGRREQGGDALMVLTVDSAIPPAVIDDIVSGIGAHYGRTVDIEES
jgi:D-3-phosphoglycerate dehydrogenase